MQGTIRKHNAARLAGVAAVIGSVLLAACGGAGGNPPKLSVVSDYSPKKPGSGQTGGTLIYADWQAPADLAFVTDNAEVSSEGVNAVFAALWAWDPKGKVVPDAVTDVPTQDNGMVKKVDATHMDVTIKLKSGLKFSDGTPITQNDLKAEFDAICDTNTGAVGTVGYDHIQTWEIKSDTEGVWHFGPDPAGTRCGLAKPLESGLYAPYLTLGVNPFMIAPARVFANHAGIATAPYFTTKPDVVSGPYMVQSFTPSTGGSLVMLPNPHYGDGRDGGKGFNHKPYLDKLIFKFYGDKASEINGLKTGDADIGFDLQASDISPLKSASNLTTQAVTGTEMEYLLFNVRNNTGGCDAQKFAQTCGKPTIFTDKAVRQAFDYAVDKDQMNKVSAVSLGVPVEGPFMPAVSQVWADSSVKRSKDVSKAKSLLEGAGWKIGSDGIATKNGQQCKFTIGTTTGHPERAAEEEIVVSSAKQIGCLGTIVGNHPASQMFNNFKAGGTLATGQFDIGLFAGLFAPDPDGWATSILSNQIPSATNASGQNYGGASDPKLDQLMLQGESELDTTKRQAIYKDVQKEWIDFAPWVSLYARPKGFSWSNKVVNMAPTTQQFDAWNQVDWYKTT